MSCFFLVDVYIDNDKGRGEYADYIEKVRPIAERCGGEYLVRTDNVDARALIVEGEQALIEKDIFV